MIFVFAGQLVNRLAAFRRFQGNPEPEGRGVSPSVLDHRSAPPHAGALFFAPWGPLEYKAVLDAQAGPAQPRHAAALLSPSPISTRGHALQPLFGR